ncbi:kinetochore-associated protein 1-like [Mizuhopecten yessoensis]|uniref:Kinetochore-associated protein 1 n=1 Tax=Mizuhopecten yessoensis TaxID=6573 RepID=A0A210Q537_MIZYE|nr:kinetochore-associated protein 1-like [Mizuhopecten yessoensis]XP_021366991.1 kinetochore-associated protein 1-like [Mizuhopecten yessoensis]OWF43847.1 Kinetochore-associated protein 1 [Mizuhopecten yessoensis]
MVWDVVNANFEGDETVNFGPRKESGIALYQIDTIATVSPRKETVVQNSPRIVTSILGELSCIAVEMHASIFKDCQFSGTLELESPVEEMEWSPDGCLLVVGDIQGKIFVINSDTMETVYSTRVCQQGPGGNAFSRIAFYSRTDVEYDLLILSSNGQLMVLSKLTPDIFLSEDKGKTAMSVKDKMTIIQTAEQHTEGVTDVITIGDTIITMGCGNRILAVWEFDNGCLQLTDEVCSNMLNGAGILQGKVTTDGVHLFLLDCNHTLSLWNLPNLTLLKQWRDLDVEQFQLLETKDVKDQSFEGMKLVILTMTKDWRSTLIIQNLPDCQNIYTLQLNAPSVISKCLTIQETLYVAECCGEPSSPESVSTVRFRCLTETNPQTRLYRILHKNQFEEAEQFAKIFGLNTEIVQKKKLEHLLEQLSPWNVMKYGEDKITEMIAQLWICMDLIHDDPHVCELAMRSTLPQMDTTRNLLSYCRKRLEKYAKSKIDESDKKNQQKLMSKLVDIQNRLITFGVAFGEEKYSGEKWEVFLKANLLQQAIMLFEQRNLLAGLVIWIRHEAEWQSNLTTSLTSKVLSWLPEQVTAKEVLGLMRDTLIPSISRLHPDSLALLIHWIIQKAKNMELQEKAAWPMNAITFLKSIHKSLCRVTKISHSDFLCTASDMAYRTSLDPATITEPIHVLINNLKHLHDLHTKYRCKLTYGQFIQETTESVTFRMLDEVVAVELMDQTLDTYIRPYMREHGLKEDNIFSQYIKDLLERVGAVTTYRSETPWEAKVIAVTHRISGPEEKCYAITEAMKWAPIPWSKEIDKLVKAGLELNHPKVVQLQKQCHIVEVKKLMLKYGLKNMAVPDRSNADKLLYLMLGHNSEGCMEDALCVMESYNIKMEKDLYIFRLRILVTKDKVEEAVGLLKSLSMDMAYTCGLRILNLVKVVLNDMLVIDQQGNEKMKRLFTEAGMYIARHLLTFTNDYLEAKELKGLLANLQCLRALQVEFGKHLTLAEFEDEAFRNSTLVVHVTEFYLQRSQDESGSNFAKIYRLADILRIPKIRLQGELAIEAARTGEVQAALKMCRELFESDPSVETADMLYKVAMAFVHLQANAENNNVSVSRLRDLPNITYRLACQSASVCSPDQLVQCLELCTAAELSLSVNNQCEAGEHSMGLEEWYPDMQSPGDQLTDDKFDTTFKEDALVMNSSVIMPLVSQYQLTASVLARQESCCTEEEENGTMLPIQKMGRHIVPVLQHLKDNSHMELAYRFSIHMLSRSTEHVTQFDMGLPHRTDELSKLAEEQQAILRDVEMMAGPWIKTIVTAVLMKIFNSQNIDQSLGMMYMASRTKREGEESLMKIIRSTGHNYKKLKALAKVGIAIGQLHHEPNLIKMCETLEKNATWGHRLGKIKISFKEAFQKPSSEKIKLLPLIAQCEAADMSLVKDFCSDFNLDQDEGLLLFLDHMFTLPDHVTLGVLAKRSLLAKARATIQEIKEDHILLNKLQIIYKKTDAYDYETLEFLLNEMQNIDRDPQRETSLKLLSYLKVYIRRKPPAEYELRYQPDGDKEDLRIIMDMLPPNSKTRLPLHPFNEGEAWKIITPELEKETVMTWLPIADLLKLSADQIYIVTVQNMVRKHVQLNKKPAVGSAAIMDKSLWNWNVKDANLSLLSDVQMLLRNVSKCELALACASWMVKELPLGAEKVEALQGCIRYAELWHRAVKDKTTEKEKAMNAFVKFTGMWQRLATEQVLFVYKVAETELVSLAGNPNKLLLKLYEHNSIVDQEIAEKDKPDIHRIAEDIASIHNVDLEQLRLSLLYRWLPSVKSKQGGSDSTVTFSFDQLNLGDETMMSADDDDEDANLRRVLYILQRGSREKNAMFLFEFAFKEKKMEEACNITNMCRVRALRCLLQIGDKAAIQKLFHKSLDQVRHMMRMMLYLVDLENLHILHTVQSFEEANKEGLIKGIWRNHRHQKTAALLVASLCLDYNIHDLQLWTSVLQQLHSFQLLSPLEYVLKRLASVVKMRQIPVLPNLWQVILSTPLTKVAVHLTLSQTELCVRYFNLILHCPVLIDIDLLSLSRHYQKLEMPSCALGCLLLAKHLHQDHIKAYLSEDAVGLLENAKHLLNFGLDQSTFQSIVTLSQDLI